MKTRLKGNVTADEELRPQYLSDLKFIDAANQSIKMLLQVVSKRNREQTLIALADSLNHNDPLAIDANEGGALSEG